MQSKIFRRITMSLASVATAALLLGGCSNGTNGINGTNGKDAANATQVSSLTTDQWAGLQATGEITSVEIHSPPVVKFKLTDSNGKPLAGLAGNTSQSSTAIVPSYANISFSLAKLVPGDPATGAPSKWVSYIVTTMPSYTSATDKTIKPAAAQRPSTDNTGTLVDNGDGTYTYTFYRDVTKVKDVVAALTDANKGDLGDLTYDPNLTHRLMIQVSGNARGTGTNTPDGTQAKDANGNDIAGVPMQNPINLVYDFIPATGKAVTSSDTQREVVSVAACFECHAKFKGFHANSELDSSSRQDTRVCVVCHTDQRKYGRTNATGNTVGGVTTYTGSTYRINNLSQGDFPTLVHRVHFGEELTNQAYNYAGVLFNETRYPQDIRNCAKCHTGGAQSDNWKTKPSRLACGSCHDSVDFATGTNHAGGAAANDSGCVGCHPAANIPAYHITVDPTGANGRGGYPLNTANNVPTNGFPSGQGPAIPLASLINPPAGLYKLAFEIKSATISGAPGAHKATVVYRILKDGAPVTFDPTIGANLIPTVNGISVDGSPDIYIAYGIPQDGITAPADWTNTVNASVKKLRDGTAGTQTGPDSNGYYTATLNNIIPDNATMATAGLGIQYNGFVQLGLPAYPQGIRLREPAFAIKLVTGQTARRPIVSNAKCNACHAQLGVKPSFHSGARNNGEGCAFCHTPNYATGHTGAANNFGGGWSVSAKDLIHGIHGSKKRSVAFNYEATVDNPNGYQRVTYPGVLARCEQCHLAGTYDFSAAATQSVFSNLLWSTMAKGDMTNPTNAATLGQSPWIKLIGRGEVDYTGAVATTVTAGRQNNSVTSPVAAACFGCHDTMSAVNHMKLNGAVIYGSMPAAGGVVVNQESCLICHGTGKSADIKAVHQKFW